MYQVGDLIVYGVHGVCRVIDFEERRVDRKKSVYLVLEPTGQGSSRYFVPTQNAAAMSKLRRLLTPAEMEALFQTEELRENAWIRDEPLRKQTYKELISSGDRASLLKMVHTLYLHKEVQYAAGKKVHQCDENFLRDAEKLLSSEVATVFQMEYSEALAYIRAKLTA